MKLRIRLSLTLLLLFVLVEATVRVVGGYSVVSLPLVRTDDRATQSRQPDIVPLAYRSGRFGAQYAPSARHLRLQTRRWTTPQTPLRSVCPSLLEGRHTRCSPGVEPAPFAYPPATRLAGGVSTDRFGWRSGAAAARPEGAAIRIALVGADFVFGEDDVSLSDLVQAALDRRALTDRSLQGRRFKVYNLGREGLDPHSFSSVIRTEAALIAPHFVAIEDVELFSVPLNFVRAQRNSKKWREFMDREQAAQLYSSLLAAPRPLSALYESVLAPLRGGPPDYEWTFARAGIEDRPDAHRKLADLGKSLDAIKEIDARSVVLGARSVVRGRQSYPRDRRALRLNWYMANGPVGARHAFQAFEADVNFTADFVQKYHAAYVNFTPLAGRLQYFDDDLTLSYSGYKWAAEKLAQQIIATTKREGLAADAEGFRSP